MTWTEFERPALRCKACGGFNGVVSPCIPGAGPPRARLAIIGEGPGENEDEQGENFVGRTGELLDGIIREVKLLRSDLWIANSVRCRRTNKAGKNRKPTMREIDFCRGFTVDELKSVQPQVIIVMGDVALTSLLGKQLGGVTEHRGKVRWSDEFNAWIVITFHPAYALRTYSIRHWIVEDLKLAKRVMEEGGPRESPPISVDFCDTLDKAYAAKADILSGAYSKVAYDWESRGVHLTKSEGFCGSFTVRPGHAYVIPRYASNWQRHWTRSELATIDHDIFRPILISDLRKVGWHIAFDDCVTKTTLGFWPRNVYFCGMTAHHLWANHLGPLAHGLKVCAAAYTPMGRYDDVLDAWLVKHGHTYQGKPDMGQVWRAPMWHEFGRDGLCVECREPEDTLRPCIVPYYNGCDSVATDFLEPILEEKMHEADASDERIKLWSLFHEERMPVVREHESIDRRGVRINVRYLDELSAMLGDALTRMKGKLCEIAENEKFNPSSRDQVADLFFEQLGMPVLERTETGLASTKEEVLLQLKDMHEAVPLLLAYRAHEKIKGTYIDGKDTVAGRKKALRAVIDEDDRARMNTHVSRAETFRFISSKPFAYHTIPKTDPKTGIPSIRALIIPDDGSLFVTRDFIQQEFFIEACLAGQWDIVDAMTNGEDVHEIVTRELGGMSKDHYLAPEPLEIIAAARDFDLTTYYASQGSYFEDEKWWKTKDDFSTYKKARQGWKSCNFMILFLGGAKKLARMAFKCTGDWRRGIVCKVEGVANCTCADRAAGFISSYYDRYDAIRWHQYRIRKELKKTGMSIGAFGAYRKLPAIFDSNKFVQFEAERQACNFPVQEGGARCMLRALIKIVREFRRRKLPARVVFTVHDEITAQAREDVAEEANEIMQTCMSGPYPELGGRSLRSSGEITYCWGG